jgi:hypothetical protein
VISVGDKNSKRVCLCIPAIIDADLISITAKTIFKNIINCNKDFIFDVFINVDNYKRSNGTGNVFDIVNIYKKELSSENSNVDMFCCNERLGVNKSCLLLLKRFLNSKSKYCVFFDDDHRIINKIVFNDFYHLYNDMSVLHLACAKKEKKEEFSYENPFLLNDIFYKTNNVIAFKNKRNFYTLPGTFFLKNQAALIYDYVSKNIKKNMIEDLVCQCSDYKKLDVFTLFYNDGNEIVFNCDSSWILPLSNHFCYDDIRAQSGFNGADLKDYN